MMLKGLLRAGAVVFAFAVAQLALQGPAAADVLSAKEMAQACQDLLATAKKTEDPDAIELDNTFQTGSCWGAFLSIQQFVTIEIAGKKNPMFQTCVPEDTTLVQIIQLFDAYVRRHPDRQSEPFTVVALGALHDAFRCKR